jgi:hypothetical protein
LSISKVHDLIQNKGCVWTVSILMILSMVAGSFVMCNPQNGAYSNQQNQPGSVIATVAGQSITERLIQAELDRGSAMYGGIANLPANFQLQLQASVLRGMVGNILQLEMAKKYGIQPTDEDIEALLSQNIDQELAQMKLQYVQQKKLAADATEAQFAEVFKKEQGQDLADVKAKAMEQNKQLLASGSDLRIPVAALAIGQPLMEAVKKEVKLTDEELKKSYDSFIVKRIILSKGDPAATAARIVKELKGGLSFERAIDRFSEAPNDPKQKASEKTEPLSRIAIRGFDAYKPIENLKPGEVSDPITIGQSVNLFKLIAIKNELPKDFATKKDTYRDTQLTSLAASKLQSDLLALQKDAKIEWKSEVYRLLYEFGRVTAENLPASERKKIEKQILDESLKLVTEGAPEDARLAGSLALVAFQSVSANASPAEAKQLEDEKVKVYEAYLTDNEDPAMRLELVQVYKNQKKGDEFFDQLMLAANANLSQADASGQGSFSLINKLAKEGSDAKLITAEQYKQVQDIQQQWIKQKQDQDKMDAEAKKAEAEAQKQAAEDAKKANAAKVDEVKTREEQNQAKGKK